MTIAYYESSSGAEANVALFYSERNWRQNHYLQKHTLNSFGLKVFQIQNIPKDLDATVVKTARTAILKNPYKLLPIHSGTGVPFAEIGSRYDMLFSVIPGLTASLAVMY